MTLSRRILIVAATQEGLDRQMKRLGNALDGHEVTSMVLASDAPLQGASIFDQPIYDEHRIADFSHTITEIDDFGNCQRIIYPAPRA